MQQPFSKIQLNHVLALIYLLIYCVLRYCYFSKMFFSYISTSSLSFQVTRALQFLIFYILYIVFFFVHPLLLEIIQQFYLLFTFIFFKVHVQSFAWYLFYCVKQFLYNLLNLIHCICLNIKTLERKSLKRV